MRASSSTTRMVGVTRFAPDRCASGRALRRQDGRTTRRWYPSIVAEMWPLGGTFVSAWKAPRGYELRSVFRAFQRAATSEAKRAAKSAAKNPTFFIDMGKSVAEAWGFTNVQWRSAARKETLP